VAAASPTDVWAVGGDGRHGTGIALHWDGQRWTVFHPHAPDGAQSVMFFSLARIAPNEIVVVGTVTPDPLFDELMGDGWGIVYRWNGNGWTKRVLDGVGSYATYDAVAVLDDTHVWIADNADDPFIPQPGTQLFRLAQPASQARAILKQGHVLDSLASDGVGLWAVGWIGSGRADPYDDEYAHVQPLIMRYGCG
jgi:hypothetical protein